MFRPLYLIVLFSMQAFLDIFVSLRQLLSYIGVYYILSYWHNLFKFQQISVKKVVKFIFEIVIFPKLPNLMVLAIALIINASQIADSDARCIYAMLKADLSKLYLVHYRLLKAAGKYFPPFYAS